MNYEDIILITCICSNYEKIHWLFHIDPLRTAIITKTSVIFLRSDLNSLNLMVSYWCYIEFCRNIIKICCHLCKKNLLVMYCTVKESLPKFWSFLILISEDGTDRWRWHWAIFDQVIIAYIMICKFRFGLFVSSMPDVVRISDKPGNLTLKMLAQAVAEHFNAVTK